MIDTKLESHQSEEFNPELVNTIETIFEAPISGVIQSARENPTFFENILINSPHLAKIIVVILTLAGITLGDSNTVRAAEVDQLHGGSSNILDNEQTLEKNVSFTAIACALGSNGMYINSGKNLCYVNLEGMNLFYAHNWTKHGKLILGLKVGDTVDLFVGKNEFAKGEVVSSFFLSGKDWGRPQRLPSYLYSPIGVDLQHHPELIVMYTTDPSEGYNRRIVVIKRS
jgi:hypothetical protein